MPSKEAGTIISQVSWSLTRRR